MSRKFRVVKFVLAGSIGAGMLSACSDRFGTFKSRKISIQEYNDWARKNGQHEIGKQIAKPSENPDKNDKEPVLSSPQPTNPFTPAKPEPTPLTDPKADPFATTQVVEGSGPEGTYSKNAWLEAFASLCDHQPALKNEILGMTVRSDTVGGKAMISVSAVVKFDGRPHLLTLNPETVAVQFDSERVKPLNIDVRSARDVNPDERAKSSIRLTATCLKPESNASPCEEVGMILDLKVQAKNVNGKIVNGIQGGFRIKIGANANGDVSQTGVEDSNMGADLKPMVEGEQTLPQETAGAASTATQSADASDKELLAAADVAANSVLSNNKSAMSEKDKAEGAHAAKNKAEAEEHAKLAEKSAAEAVEAEALVVSLTTQVSANLKTEAAKARVIKMIEESKQLKDEAVEAAKAARKAADETVDAEAPPARWF